MAVANSENTSFDEKLFLEIKNKCAVMGLEISKEGFIKYRDNYIELAKKYDAAATNFLFSNNQRHRQISKEIVAKENIPEFMAFIKAKQTLIAEFNEQVAHHTIQIVDNEILKHLAKAEQLCQQQQKQLKAKKEQQEAENKIRLKEEEEKERLRLEAKRKAEEERERLRIEAERKAAKEQARLRLEAERKAAKEQARLRLEAERKAAEEQARLEAEQKLKREKERLLLQAEKQRLELEAQRKKEVARKKRREERKAKLDAKWNAFKDNVFSVSASFQTARKSLADWGNLLKGKVNILVTDCLAYKKKVLEHNKAKYQLTNPKVKKVGIKTLKVAATTVPFVIGSYYAVNTMSVSTSLNPLKATSHNVSQDTLSTQQREEMEWEWEASSNRDIDDSSFLNDTLSYGVLATSPNMALFSKCFDECNRRLGEQSGYGVTDKMRSDFRNENLFLAKRYAGYLWHRYNLIYERIVAKAQVFDKYDIASFHNPNIASYMYNLVLQQNNDSTVHRVQALADGIRDFYDICGKELSYKQEQALNHLSDFNGESVDVHDWRHVIATVNNVIDPAEEKALFEHIKTSVADSYVSFIVPNTTDYIDEKKSDLRHEKRLYAFAPVIGADTYEEDSIAAKQNLIDDSSILGDFIYSFADHDFANVLQKPVALTTYEEQANAKLEADIAAFRRLHLQAYHDMYVKMQYGMESLAFIEANQALHKHGQQGLVKGYFCSGTSIACLCIASDKMKEINPDNYVSKAIDNIVRNLTNPHYCNALQQDLSKLATKTLGKEETNKLYHSTSSSLLNECTKEMEDNPGGFMYVWTVRYHNNKTGETKYHHQACLPALNVKFPYTYAAFNGNHWDTNNTRFRKNLSGKTFNMGEFVYKLAEQYKNRDVENYNNNIAENNISVLKDDGSQSFTFVYDVRQNSH